jgi:hypothetical protein
VHASAVPRTLNPVFIFCAPGPIFAGTAGVGSSFHVLRSRTYFRRYRGRQIQFSCFMLPDPFLTVPTTPCPVFMFCAPRLIFDGTEGVGSGFLILHPRTRFLRYRWRQVQLSCFTLSDPLSVVLRASILVFIFCALGRVFNGTKDVGSSFHILHVTIGLSSCYTDKY